MFLHKKQKSLWRVPHTRQPLRRILAMHATGSSCCNRILPHHLICLGILFFFRGHVYDDLGWFGSKLLLILFSYLQLFYLHWLFLIRFYFPFSSLVIWFFNLFSNLVLILLVFICFVLNHFLHWFFFNSTPRHLFLFNFYINFGHNSFNFYFLIIFLMDLFLTITSLNI